MHQYPQHQSIPMNMKKMCMDHMHRYVLVQTREGKSYDGIVEHVDDRYVYLAVPNGMGMDNREGDRPNGSSEEYSERSGEDSDQRQFYGGFPGYGFPGYGGVFPGYGFPGYGGFFPGYGYGFGRRRRFNRLLLPLAALTAISLLPYYYY